MVNSQNVRRWATPLTIGAFALSAITGIMLFFHVNIGLVKPAHEWFSWFLVLGGLFHVIGSWQPFVGHFSRPAAKVIMTVFALLIVISLFPAGERPKGMPAGKMSGILLQSPLSTVAVVAGHGPQEAMEALASQGIHVETKDETIQEIAKDNNKRGVDILEMIF